MPSKKTTKTKKEEPKEPKRTPEEEVTEIVFDTVFTGKLPNNPDRMKLAKALTDLRMYELKKETDLEISFLKALSEARQEVYRVMIKACIRNELRFIDSVMLMEAMFPEMAVLAVWEYEHLDEATDLIEGIIHEDAKGEITNIADIFNSLGKNKSKDPLDGDDLGED